MELDSRSLFRPSAGKVGPVHRQGNQRMEPLDRLDDAALADGLVARDEAVLGEVYRRHGGVVYGLATRVLRDADRAEEVVQEVFLRLWNEPTRYVPDRGALRSFLCREAHSRAIERVRSEEARRRREERHDREEARDGLDVEGEAWKLIRSELVAQALEELSEGERQAISLAYFGGHSYRDVAAILELPEGTVKSRIRLGLNKLADRLEASGLGVRP